MKITVSYCRVNDKKVFFQIVALSLSHLFKHYSYTESSFTIIASQQSELFICLMKKKCSLPNMKVISMII